MLQEQAESRNRHDKCVTDRFSGKLYTTFGCTVYFVLAATYLTTRWMGGMQRGRQNNKNLHVIETISVGNNKTISIVEAGSVYLVVSVGKEEVHLLAQLTRDQLKDFSFELEQSGKKQDSFAEILNQLKDKLPKKQG